MREVTLRPNPLSFSPFDLVAVTTVPIPREEPHTLGVSTELNMNANRL